MTSIDQLDLPSSIKDTLTKGEPGFTLCTFR